MEKSTQFATEERGEKFFGPPAREPLDKERLSRQVWDSMRNGRFTAQRFFDTGTTKTDSTYKESSRSRSRSRNKVELPEELEGFGEPASKETGENKRDGSSDEGSDGRRDRNREDDSELEKRKRLDDLRSPARIREYHNLRYRSANHGSAPDAVLRIPENFDPNKPFDVVVYNHGFYSTAKSSIPYNDLDNLMRKAPPNTLLILPEWQVSPSAKSSNQGRFSRDNQFRNMLQEVFDKTPELKGKSVNDIAGIHILSHSAGHNAANSELYSNDLGDKVRTVVDLDSQYNPRAYDRWIQNNIDDIACGNKRFYSIGYDKSYATRSLSDRVGDMLRRAGFRKNIMKDFKNPMHTLSGSTFRDNSLVFKTSEATLKGRGAHMSMPELYVDEILESLR